MVATNNEAALIQQAKAGDEEALGALVNEHRKNIHYVAHSYCAGFKYNVIDINDLEQEGAIGFIRAVGRFDPERKVPLWKFAEFYVKQHIIAMLREMGKTIRVPEDAVALANEAQRIETQWTQQNLSFTKDDIANELGISVDYLKTILVRIEASYVDAPWEDAQPDDDSPKSHTSRSWMASDFDVEEFVLDAMEHRGKISELLSMLDDLTPREKRVMIKHYGLNGKKAMTLAKIAHQWKCDPSEVSRNHTSAKSKLAAMARGKAQQ